MSICISDVAVGTKIVLTLEFGEVEGEVVANYGASLGIKVSNGNVVIVSNQQMTAATLTDSTGVARFILNFKHDRRKFAAIIGPKQTAGFFNRLVGIYRFVWDFPVNWKPYGWRPEQMTDSYWEGL